MDEIKFDKKAEKLKCFTSKKSNKLLVFLGLAGMLLLMVSELIPQGNDTSGKDSNSEFDYRTYESSLENRLTSLLSEIEGAGNVKVMVTLEGGSEYIYAVNENVENVSTSNSSGDKNDKNSLDNEFVLLDNGKEALLQNYTLPQIRGVAIICEGAEDVSIEKRVTEAAAVVLGLSTNKISVTKMT